MRHRADEIETSVERLQDSDGVRTEVRTALEDAVRARVDELWSARGDAKAVVKEIDAIWSEDAARRRAARKVLALLRQ